MIYSLRVSHFLAEAFPLLSADAGCQVAYPNFGRVG